MLWVELKEMWASGWGGVDYINVDLQKISPKPLDVWMEKYINELDVAHSWSDKFRGHYWTLMIGPPPEEWLQRGVEDCQLKIQSATQQRDFLRGILEARGRR